MNDRNLTALRVQICYDLAKCSGRFLRRFLRRTFRIDFFVELPLFGKLPIAASVKDFSQRIGRNITATWASHESDNRQRHPSSPIAILEQHHYSQTIQRLV